MKSNALATVAVLALLMAAGCSRSDSVGSATASTAVATPKEVRYPLTGEIISVDAARRILVVRHDEVKGLMPAMTMEFAVSAADAAEAKPGQRIRAELVPSKTGDFRLEKIWPDDKVAADTVAAGARVLREDTHNRGNAAYREVGEKIPDFALYDQEGRVVQSARFGGKQIMINFIFTRCPVANMCPASTLKMMATQKLARAAAVPNLELVSITLDPAYDTPGVLKEYATERGIITDNFSFLTGPESAIRDLLTHTLTTLLIDENGKIIHRADGSVWEPKDFVAKMRKG